MSAEGKHFRKCREVCHLMGPDVEDYLDRSFVNSRHILFQGLKPPVAIYGDLTPINEFAT